ncbi:MAG TPA: serine/threonine-protein kinase [Leptolyngbyaceae cyanobacterium]
MMQVGQVLRDRYQLQQKLGYAANRQTWLASDLSTHSHQLVIVKLLAFVGEVQWEDIKLFEREAQVLKQLDYPTIPKYRDYFCLNEQLLWFGLVQEYIPGVTFQDLLQQGEKFTEQQIRQIATDILNILVYLHELNPSTLHRDIKPSNLIWGEDQRVYLVDFGAVQNKALSEMTFTVVGTYGYTPMEQFGGRAIPASDLYALGATLIHLLTGIAPADLPQKNLQIQFAEFVSLSPSFVAWLQQLCEPAIEKRFSTASVALSSLESGILLSSSTLINNSGQGGLFDLLVPVPEEIQGWNWGAFLLTPFWLVSNRVWIGIFAFVPIIGVWMAIALGIKGNEWAWKSRKWESIESFQAYQKRWAIAAVVTGISINLIFWHLGILLFTSALS